VGSCLNSAPTERVPIERSDAMMNNSTREFERLLGSAALALWSDLPRGVQENLFEAAVAGDDIVRNHLACYLHDHHPRTAHPTKPTRKA
jgi:hypothetical protein